MNLRISWNELFPTKWSVVIFISYMALFINQGILVTASQSSTSTYSYNTVTVVLLTEVVKLLVSVSLYCKDNAVSSLLHETKLHIRVMLLYFVPAFLYCLYNNLAFINLSAFDPTTYYLLLQFRVVVTGIAFQVLFKKKLSGKQWLSLILLTVGCMMKETDKKKSSASTGTSAASETGFHFSFNALLIVIQTLCSSFAGVYSEYLLKGEGADVNVFVQNVFMCVDSIICIGGILLVQGELYSAFTWEALSSVFTFKVMIIMFNNAAIGIITSFFLKNLNSILKTFASALELMFTAVLCWLIFGIPIYVNTVIAISIVSYAVILYSQNPVTLCSSFAGVYNEYLLKGDGADVSVFVQNVFMYVDSIICNGGILLVQGELYSAFTWEALSSVFTFKVMIIMFNNAAIGIITSFFLKNLNSILKTFASALELMFTAVLCWLIFGIPIYVNTVIAISIVSYAVIIYSQNPVVNQPQKEVKQTEEKEKEELLDVTSA